jgi:hypothetical protein
MRSSRHATNCLAGGMRRRAAAALEVADLEEPRRPAVYPPIEEDAQRQHHGTVTGDNVKALYGLT